MVPQSEFGKCLLNRSHPNWIRWYQAETYSKEDMRGTWYGNHCAIQKTVQGYRKWQKVANNGLVGVPSRGDECRWLHRHAITPCNVEQVVCAVHTAPYLGVGVKQAVSLVGEDLCEACKQSKEIIGSDDVTWSKWIYSMTILDRHQQPQHIVESCGSPVCSHRHTNI